MKLKVYQQGGGLIYTPFIPGAQGTASSSSTGTSGGEDDKLDPISKEILALMKESNLLPSDIQMIYNRLISFQKRIQNIPPGMGYSTIMPGLLQLQQLVAIAKDNKKRFDDSAQLMTNREAGGELALDSYGRMWVMDKETKSFKTIDPYEFDREKYQPLSNSELLDLRRRSPLLAFDENSFETVGNDIIGMKQVQQEISAVIKDFGTRKSDNFEIRNIANLAKEIAEKGYFKVTLENTRSLDDINGFTNLLWNSLGNNVRNLLTARAALKGENPLTFLADMIIKDADISKTSDFDSSLSRATGGADDTGGKNLKEDTYQIRFANGEGNDVDVALVPKASKISDKAGLLVKGKDFGPMLNFKELPLEPMNLQRLLFTGGDNASALATSVRSTDITFGNRLLDETELPAIMYGADSLTSKVYLPYSNKNGHFVPNFDVIQGFNKFIKAYKKNMTTTEKNALLQECDLKSDDIIENKDGTFSLKNTMPFLTFSAYAGDDTINFTDTEKNYLEKVDRSKGRLIADLYNNAIKYDNAYAKKDAAVIRKKYGKSEAGDFWKGLVFIPVPDAFYAYNSTSNQYLSPQEFNNVSARVQANNVQNALRSQAQADPNYSKYSTIGQWYE